LPGVQTLDPSALQLTDSGLLAALPNLFASRLETDRMPFGAVLETFVLAEILKPARWYNERLELFWCSCMNAA
jgi:hypothetical protein